MLGDVFNHVDRQLHGRFDRQELRAAGDVFLDRVVLNLKGEVGRTAATALDQGQEPGDRDRADRIGGAENVAGAREGDAVEDRLEILQ